MISEIIFGVVMIAFIVWVIRRYPESSSDDGPYIDPLFPRPSDDNPSHPSSDDHPHHGHSPHHGGHHHHADPGSYDTSGHSGHTGHDTGSHSSGDCGGHSGH